MDQLYAEDYVESGYAVYVADAITLTAAESQVITVAGIVYQLEVEPLSLFDVGVTANLTVAPDVFLESDTQFSTDAVKTGVADSTLDNIVNLSLQSDRFRDIIAAALAETAVEGQLSTLFNSTAQFNTEAVFVCSFDVINNLEPVDLSTTVDMQVIGGFLIELIDPYFDTGYFDPGYFEGDTVDLPGQFAFACEAEIIIQSTQLFAEFALTADLTAAPIEFESALDAVFACDVTAQVIVDTVINISGTFAQTTSAEIVKQIDSNAVGVFEQNADAQRIRSIDAVFDNAFAQTVDIDRIRFADAAVDSAFDQSTSGDRFRAITSEQNTDAQLTAQGGFVQSADVEMTGAFSPMITVDITLRGEVYMEFTASLAADAIRIQSSAVEPINTTATVTAAGLAVRLSYSAELIASIADPSPEGNNRFGSSVFIDSNLTYWASAPGELNNKGIVYQYNPARTITNPGVDFSNFGETAISVNRSSIFVSYGPASNQVSGRVYEFDKATGNQIRQYTSTFTGFSSSIASSTSRLAVGAPQSTSNSGRVVIYNLFESGVLMNTLAGDASSLFGSAVALNDSYLVVGAPDYNTRRGRVYIYDAVLNTTPLIRTIDNPMPTSTSPTVSDGFGSRISVWNNLAAISAFREDTTADDVGVVYVYDINTGNLIFTLNNPTPQAADQFGADVAITENYIAVTCPGKDIPESNSGVVYIFSTKNGQLLTTILNPNAFGTAVDDQFSFRLSMNGNRLVTGVTFEDASITSNTGRVYVFDIIEEASEPIDVVAETQLTANLTRAPYEFESYQTVEAIVQATAIKTASSESDQITNAQIAATVLRIQQLAAELNTTSELGCAAGAIRPAESDLATDATAYAFADKIKTNAVDMIVTVEVDATATQIFGFAADWSITTDFAALAGIRYSLSAAGFAQTSVLATGRIIDLNKEVWRITKENRTFAIEPETRDYTIAREQRVWSIT